jgi:pimeloyl-ACP methyl ester carboxylesterase
MPFLTLPGCDLYYEVTGSGPALVFAHGLGGNQLSWWQQVPHFRARYTCITFAHRGFTPSTGGTDPGPRAFVDDLEALIDHLGLADVRLVAQSMGGWTCLGYTLRHPERVRALVMCDTTGSLHHPEIERIWAARTGNPEAELFARGIHPAAGERMAREQPALHYLYHQINNLAVGLDKQAVRDTLASLRITPAEQVAALRVPLLCIAGEEDIVIPPEAVAVLASLVPGARLERVPRAGHSVYFERPDTFNALLDTLLQSVD